MDVYGSLVRSIVEYGAVVFAHMPQYLSSTLGRIQERAPSIMFPGVRLRLPELGWLR